MLQSGFLSQCRRNRISLTEDPVWIVNDFGILVKPGQHLHCDNMSGIMTGMGGGSVEQEALEADSGL